MVDGDYYGGSTTHKENHFTNSSMSDSAKLRFIYALISYIVSFLTLAAMIVLSFLVGFNIIPSDFTGLVIILVIPLIISITAALGNFMSLYNIGKKEH